METPFQRTELLIGKDNQEALKNKTVAIFGVGGVGGYCVEALARCGIGHLVLIDNDEVNITNINRQIIATHTSIGKKKVDAFKERIFDINPECKVDCFPVFYLPENSNLFDFTQFDYVIDAIDTVTAKIDIIVKCNQVHTPIISAMGAGNKIHPEMLTITDLYKTEMDPLAKVMRHELKKRGIDKLKVVYSKEVPIKPQSALEPLQPVNSSRRATPGSISFVPSVAGLLIASEVIRDLINL